MKFLRNLLPIAVVALSFSSAAVHAACFNDSFHDETRQRDFEAVQEYVNSKRTISLEEKACNLSIAGDIRFDWAHITERVNCHRLRSGDDKGTARQIEGTNLVVDVGDPSDLSPIIQDARANGLPFSNNEFDVEFNLYFDYICDRSWGVAWLQFDENAGIEHTWRPCSIDRQTLQGSGCCGDLCLKKAYMGYNICADGCSRFDIEVGRRPLYTVFDSRVEFQSRFDGVLFKYARQFECWGDFYWNAGLFVVDERVDHFGIVTELGMLNIYDCGLDFKYSYIDWKALLSHRVNRCLTQHPRGAEYEVSQFSAAYHFNPEYLCMPTKIYGAFLFNSAAKRVTIPDRTGTHSKQNIGWYLGFIIGEVCHEGDWAFDVNYQLVQLQAIPDQDVGGIGANGNNLLGNSAAGSRRGFTNYKGWRFEGLYALTDNLSIDAILEFSKQDKKIFAGKHSYSKFELQAIYAF